MAVSAVPARICAILQIYLKVLVISLKAFKRKGIQPICYHPLMAVQTHWEYPDGKNRYKILKYGKNDNPSNRDYITIPCGKCIGCRLRYSLEWAARLMCELQYHDKAWFVTLTYSDDYLPKHPVTDENGVYLYDQPTLRKKHVSKFIKHVRKHYGEGIRFYSSGEYGERSIRPHYHLILFGLDLPDLKLYKRTARGDALYNSPGLSRCWSNYIRKEYYDPVGHVVVAPVTWQTCAYVARYVTKKMDETIYSIVDKTGIEPPFSLMSRNPGIGSKYFEEHKETMFELNNIVFPTDKGIKKASIPKYFLKLLEKEDEVYYNDIRKQRLELAQKNASALVQSLDMSYMDYLAVVEDYAADKIKLLRRDAT